MRASSDRGDRKYIGNPDVRMVAGGLRFDGHHQEGAHTMIWLLERKSDLLVCEIRRASDGDAYEFEVAGPSGSAETRQYTSPRELIDQYLRTQMALKAQGWRPRATDMSGDHISGHYRSSMDMQ
jgi:hypothetical protein